MLFSYAQEVSESGALDTDEKDEDIPGRLKCRLLNLTPFSYRNTVAAS